MAIRKFFFDDGRSRKRWHVDVKGKSQIVQYGRLYGSLRESKKSFKSSAEAKQQTKKLIAKKQRDSYVEIAPERLEINRTKGRRKATDAQIKALEKQLGSKLPVEYRDFLQTINGGRPNPQYVGVPGNKMIESIGVGLLNHLRPNKPQHGELTYEIERSELFEYGHVPIASDSDIYSISLNQKTLGCVFWWFHETDEVDDDGKFYETAGYLLAGSFNEFLTRIAVLYGTQEFVCEIDEPNQEPQAKSKNQTTSIRQLIRLLNHDHTPQKTKEIVNAIKKIGDLSGIKDGNWPFINLSESKILRALLDAGLNPEIIDKERQSLLWQCAGSRECIDMLCKKGVDVDRRSGNHAETALMRAIFAEEISAVKMLIAHGANPILRPPSHINRRLKSNSKLRKVVEDAKQKWKQTTAKKEPNKRSIPKQKQAAKIKRSSPEYKKAIKKFLRLMKHDHLPEGGEEFKEIDAAVSAIGDLSGVKNGEFPSIDKFENPKLLRVLLEAGLNPNIIDKNGASLLSQCVSHPDCIELVVRFGGDPNLFYGRKKKNQTALMRASYAGEDDCVQRLLKLGADPTVEFTGMAKIFLDMDEGSQAVLKKAQAKWNRQKKKKSKK